MRSRLTPLPALVFGGWPMAGGGNPLVEDPVTQDERDGIAAVCMAKLALEPMPALADDMHDTAGNAYRAHPDRLFLIGEAGTLVSQGGPGPFTFTFKPDELEDALRVELGESHTRTSVDETP